MNTYSDNLHATVLATLQNLNAKEKELSLEESTVQFTFQEAKFAAIAAEERLEAANKYLAAKTSMHFQVLKVMEICNTLVNVVGQANQYVIQSVFGTAQAAANIQVSTNAIVRLASDMGSVFSLVNAADYGTDIFLVVKEVYTLMNEVAADAEHASQTAMEAAMLIAEVSSSSVLEKAATVKRLIEGVLNNSKANLDSSFADILKTSNSLTDAIAVEKENEGRLEIATTAHAAARSVYKLINSKLNLDLKVSNGEHALSFKVKFNPITSPFDIEKPIGMPYYPVERYYVIVVKDSNKQNFSELNAQMLLAENEPLIEVPALKKEQLTNLVEVLVNDIKGLKDADNDLIIAGVAYVVFVMAIFDAAYKKKIISFSDYLSAPSQAFTLSNKSDAYVIPKNEKAAKNSKFNIDRLKFQITQTQQLVNISEHTVNSLTSKNSDLQLSLDSWTNKNALAKDDNIVVEQLEQVVAELKNNAEVAFDEISQANTQVNALFRSICTVQDKLIFTSSLLEKLINLIARKKAVNPLISDDLVSLIATAGKDANNAVALVLIAIQSTIAAQKTEMEAESILKLVTHHVSALKKLINHVGENNEQASLSELLHMEYDNTNKKIKHFYKSKTAAALQLSEATRVLNEAQTKLSSLQSGMQALATLM
ncbi:hypothetical protein DBR40_07915 [Pedobacter sp. KBW01]|uniref:hypothetical protein n=1 Tax=Pedobacter sp. KBW01 TaxID=2153364 RepID=UPI000F5B6D5F|nr:hypothetical protein [Pedobacter sp. KBW01]RQO77882.1 hypothetical protein DBR40_07915 [Pedobacter sp. KBW01]